MMRTAIAMGVCASLVCSCSSLFLDDRPCHAPTVLLSKLAETTIEFDSSRYAGINLIITNDLKSDIFLKNTSDEFVAAPVNTDKAFRLPDMDERYRPYKGTGVYPLEYAEGFMFIWTGSKGFYHINGPGLSAEKTYFPITYYHCNDKGFYTRSIRIIEANKMSEPGIVPAPQVQR